MKKISWSVTLKGREVDGGCLTAVSERDALEKLMARPMKVKATESYVVRVGGLVASAYGDEFVGVSAASGLDDTKLEGDHLFRTLKKGGVGFCPHSSMNRDFWIGSHKYAACDDCDFVNLDTCIDVSLDHVVRIDSDSDREREKKALRLSCAHNDLREASIALNGMSTQACRDCGKIVTSLAIASSDPRTCGHPVIRRFDNAAGVSWDCPDCKKMYRYPTKVVGKLLRRSIHPIHIRQNLS